MKKIVMILCILGIGKTTQAQWLPIGGGALTGPLTGTSAAFSGPVTARGVDIYGEFKIQEDGALQGGLDLYTNWPNTHPTTALNFWAYYNTSSPLAVIEAGQSNLATNDGMILLKTTNAGITPSERMRITGEGNIGIGTASPVTKLHISGGEITLDNGQAINFNGTASGYSPYIYYNVAGNDLLVRNNVASGTVSIGATAEAIRVLSSGNVGIGTATPDPYSKLTVAGKIHSQEVKVTATAGADFVFEDDYKLRSLVETEAFIKQNKHLPEIASANEMVKNGIELGEMNVKLLQKIEELTLHLIEMGKENKEQGAKIKDLEQKINSLNPKP